MTSPLLSDGSNFPCKGYQDDDAEPVITYTAGSTYNITLSGSATHNGGSCQLSLSYDNGASFRVIKSMMGGCPLQSTYDFTIPFYMPAGDALLAWTWQNKVGNREFYMNCAAVTMESGSPSRKQRREAATSFNALPNIWRANLAGLGDCATSEGSDPVYPNPGPDVEYGDDVTSDSLPSLGDCDGPMGQAYRAPGDTDEAVSYVYEPTEAAESTTEPTYLPAATDESEPFVLVDTTEPEMGSSENSYPLPGFNGQARVLELTTQPSYDSVTTLTYSITTVYVDCPDTVTFTIYPSPSATTTITAMPSQYTTSVAACTGTSASCPCAQGFACDEIAPCTWACNARPTPTARSTWSYTRSTLWTTRTTRPSSRPTSSAVISRTTAATVRPSSIPPPQPTNRPTYATGNVNRYLPCVPGTFICTSKTTWDTCDWNDNGSEWVYGYDREVSDGMMCLTNTSPYSSETDQYAQQAMTPAGYYRDDRIVRDRPDGDCDQDGSILCTDGGQKFDICDPGGWVRMGSVADGTICEYGRIVARN